MNDLRETVYVEPPRCSHRSLDDGGFCYDCGATLRWVVEKDIDYEAAEDVYMHFVGDHSPALRAAVDAAIGE